MEGSEARRRLEVGAPIQSRRMRGNFLVGNPFSVETSGGGWGGGSGYGEEGGMGMRGGGDPKTLHHRDNALLYIAYVMLIWAAPIPADRWHCSLWP